jgi:HlyD family secretion protein
MKNIFTSFLNFIKAHKVWSVIIGLAVIVIIYFIFFGGKKADTATFVLVEKGNIREEVSVTGNVKPLSEVDLAFERGGRVAGLNVVVGDRIYQGQVLASVSNADLLANLDQAKANLKKVLASAGDSADKTALDFTQSKDSLVSAIKDSYTKADDAVRNKIYSLFNDPAKYRARLAFNTDTFLQEEIEEGKDDINDTLDAWNRTLIKTDISLDPEANYNLAKTNLSMVKTLLDKCAKAVNGLSAETAGISQTQIDTWKLNISTARTNINTAVDTLNGYYDAYKSAGLAIKISRNTTLAEEAGIEQAEAQVASAEAELAKSIIRSPISGLITKVDVKLGEIVSANKNIISVISYGDYEVESFVPEADISKVKVDDLARTTLDAYGDTVVFETKVIKIDPAATVIDGVPTYKTTLRFVAEDERVRAGMTANLDILTAERADVLVVPARAVYVVDGKRFVKVLDLSGVARETEVVMGLRGSDGKVEIISGLNEGDKVVTSL